MGAVINKWCKNGGDNVTYDVIHISPAVSMFIISMGNAMGNQKAKHSITWRVILTWFDWWLNEVCASCNSRDIGGNWVIQKKIGTQSSHNLVVTTSTTCKSGALHQPIVLRNITGCRHPCTLECYLAILWEFPAIAACWYHPKTNFYFMVGIAHGT